MNFYKRPLWVRGPSGHRLHVKFNRSEGMTICGIPVGTAWRWQLSPKSRLSKCKHCCP